mgnify:CR=1 FL=1
MTRTSNQHRKTAETEVSIQLNLDGDGRSDVSTGVGFYDHLISSLAYHGMFNLSIDTAGDLHIDEHHTVEDTALVLGAAIGEALGDRCGINRFGEATIPMDEALAKVSLDAGGRPYAAIDIAFQGERIGILSTQMIPHALESLAKNAGVTIHISATGKNDHHIAEAVFKAVGRALRSAVAIDSQRSGIPSTKGAI